MTFLAEVSCRRQMARRRERDDVRPPWCRGGVQKRPDGLDRSGLDRAWRQKKVCRTHRGLVVVSFASDWPQDQPPMQGIVTPTTRLPVGGSRIEAGLRRSGGTLPSSSQSASGRPLSMQNKSPAGRPVDPPPRCTASPATTVISDQRDWGGACCIVGIHHALAVC